MSIRVLQGVADFGVVQENIELRVFEPEEKLFGLK